ncbi:MAG: hypothetical protein V9E98_07430 [Candidatus Nanopelagicales bacterium]
MSTSDDTVTELIGVYHADGGPIGEAKYVLGKLLGTAHCALCDVTHSPVRRKPQWDAMVSRMGIPVTLLHLNEQPTDVAAATQVAGTPVVLARLTDGSLQVALSPDQLDQLGGSVSNFESAVITSIDHNGWSST